MLSKHHTPGGPKGATRHAAADSAGGTQLAMMSRANHDMRSPLSVILGVFELLEESTALSPSERRYLALGSEAAESLLSLADALRLHASLERGQVNVDAAPVDLPALALEALGTAFQPKGATITLLPAADGSLRALGDADYLPQALTALARDAASRFSEADSPDALNLGLNVLADGSRVIMQLLPADGTIDALPADSPPEALQPGACDLAVINAARLIALMHGTVNVDSEGGRLTISLPAATPV